MRFLLECVGCCAMSTTNSSTVEPTSPATPRTEETISLVSPATEARLRRRRSRTSSSAEWKPSLFAISEDNDGPVRSEMVNRNRPAKIAVSKSTAGPRNVQRCGPSSVSVNAHARSSHEFGQNPLPMFVPAFATSPFMF